MRPTPSCTRHQRDVFPQAGHRLPQEDHRSHKRLPHPSRMMRASYDQEQHCPAMPDSFDAS